MSEFIVTNAVTRAGDGVDIEIRNGDVHRIVPAGDGDPKSFAESRRYDAEGRLVTPPLVEPHTHLDAALTAGVERWNESGTLAESFDIWDDLQASLTVPDMKARARRTIEWFVAHGVTRIRSHVGIENQPVFDALLDLREEMSHLVDIQFVAFPHAFVSEDGKEDLFRETIEKGADVVGGMPHGEATRERGVEHVETVVELAETYDRPMDLHIDETDDPESRFTAVLAAEARDRGLGDRTTASHFTAMHSYSNAYAEKVSRLVADSGLSVVTNPLVNTVLQGRYDSYPRRRGLTRVDELRDRGVTVGIGQDDIVDTAYAYGDGDPLKAVFVLLHVAHMNTHSHVSDLWKMLVEGNAEIYGLDPETYGLREGADGSLVVYNAPDAYNALRTLAPRTLVLKDGEPVARSRRRKSVGVNGQDHVVDFSHDP